MNNILFTDSWVCFFGRIFSKSLHYILYLIYIYIYIYFILLILYIYVITLYIFYMLYIF